MIARQWIGETREPDAEKYAKYLEETGIHHCKGIRGNCGVLLLKRIYDCKAQFIFISFWDSLEAIKAFAGPNYEKAVYYSEDQKFLLATLRSRASSVAAGTTDPHGEASGTCLVNASD